MPEQEKEKGNGISREIAFPNGIWVQENASIHNHHLAIRNPQSPIRNHQSAIINPQSSLRNRQSEIRNPPSAIRDLQSRKDTLK